MGASGGNLNLLAALGVVALTSVEHLESYWSLQRRHPDGAHWLDLAHYATHDDAGAALERVVAADHAQLEDLRITRVTRSTS